MNDFDEFFEERAAIMQFDGGLPKEKAEALAKAEAETYRNAINNRIRASLTEEKRKAA